MDSKDDVRIVQLLESKSAGNDVGAAQHRYESLPLSALTKKASALQRITHSGNREYQGIVGNVVNTIRAQPEDSDREDKLSSVDNYRPARQR